MNPQPVAAADCRERAVLVAVIRDNQDPRQTEEFLDELEFLAETADICSVKRFTQRLPQPSSRIYVGPGKLEEIAAYCREHEIDVVIFDDELTPSQTRNIEKEMPCRLLDRTRLILDIFMSRARTAYAKTQVQLANYEYMLPRLSGLWTHLERQRGGTGTRGGAGEREIETDRRIIRNRIAKLKEDLKKIDRQMAVQRSQPRRNGPRGVGRLYQRGQIDADEPDFEKRGFRREQALRHARHHGPQGGFRQSALPAFGHGGLYPQTAYGTDRVVQIDAGRGSRSRPAGCMWWTFRTRSSRSRSPW